MIKYKSGYKYQLTEDYTDFVAFKPPQDVVGAFYSCTKAGRLTIKAGYAWDGPSGPTIDTPNFMRGSLIHDLGYQMLREGKLSRFARKTVDQELRRVCKEDGMSSIRAWWVYEGVRFGGVAAADPASKKPVITAP